MGLTLRDDAQGTADAKFRRLEEMAVRGGTVSVRTGTERLFAEVTDVGHTRHRWGYEVDVTVEERIDPEADRVGG